MNKLEQNTQIYLDTAQAFVDLVDKVPLEVYDAPGLGRWTVVELIAHTGRALRTVIDYVSRPAASVEQHTPQSYYHATRATSAAEDVYERSVAAAADLRQGASEPMHALLDEVTHVLDGVDPDNDGADAEDSGPVVTTAAGGMRLATYLSTRILELCIHSLDLSHATGVPVDLPADAIRITLEVESELAVLDGVGSDLALALAGRKPLPPTFTVIQ